MVLQWILVVPELTHTLVLGIDFWRVVRIIPDLRRGEWVFSSQATHCDAIEPHDHLSIPQKKQLDQLIKSVLPEGEDDKLGCTTLVEHTIVTHNSPIKQRYYPISPAMQKIVNAELDKLLASTHQRRRRSLKNQDLEKFLLNYMCQ